MVRTLKNMNEQIELIQKGDIVTLVINGCETECTAIEVVPHKITFEDNETKETFDVWKHYAN